MSDKSKVKPIPDGYAAVSCYLIVENSLKAMDFYARAFGAEPGHRMAGPDGQSTMHAEMHIGGCTFMLTDANESWGMKSARHYGGSPVTLHLYVEDVDALFERAVKAGCEVKFPVNDAFWGDRYAKVVDPFGIEWGLATHKEDLTTEELEKRGQEWFARMAQGGGCEDA